MRLFARDSPATVEEIADGRVQHAIINPSMMPELTALGSAPFKRPIPLRMMPVLTPLDFSGWPIYTHRDTPDAMVEYFCCAFHESKDRIPWAAEAPLPLAQMVRDTPEGHLEVSRHPAAERYWRERGYLE